MHEPRGKAVPYYYRPADEDLVAAIENNLLRKYELIYKQPATALSLKFEPDQHYITRRQSQGKRVTKKVTIKEGDAKNATDIVGFEVPFTLTGSPQLMQVAYDCGIGEKNSLGFGMIELAGPSRPRWTHSDLVVALQLSPPGNSPLPELVSKKSNKIKKSLAVDQLVSYPLYYICREAY